MKIKKVYAKSILNPTGLSTDFCINPYTGCSHSCVYCYARFMKRYTNHQEEWGDFVDIKINAPQVLEKQLKNAKPGKVLLSSVCDPYQALEKKYKITRQILKLLLAHNFSVSILTKSDLVLRDLDLLKKFKNSEVGFSLNTLSESVKEKFEPGSPSIKSRLKALKELHQAGIKTWVFIAPILPGLTDAKKIKEKVSGIANWVWTDNLNIKCGNWPLILKVVKKHYPKLLASFSARKPG